MDKYTHNCIRCNTQYEDVDPDPYYCEPCNEEKKEIAKKVDKEVTSRVGNRNPKSDLQMYDEIRKSKGTQFVNIKDLGLKL